MDDLDDLKIFGFMLWASALFLWIILFALYSKNVIILGCLLGSPFAYKLVRWFIKQAWM